MTLAGNALWQLVKQSDVVSKGVLLLLLGVSIVSWTIFISRMLLLKKHKNDVRQFLATKDAAMPLRTLLEKTNSSGQSLVSYFITHVTAFLHKLVKNKKDQGSLDEREIACVRDYADQLVDYLTEQERAGLYFVSTAAGIGPLLGLFGTVWGLVHAFVRISEQQTADIATVAPGIAEALITTLAGLMVAIPALVMFNCMQVTVRQLETLLQQIADTVVTSVQCTGVFKEE